MASNSYSGDTNEKKWLSKTCEEENDDHESGAHTTQRPSNMPRDQESSDYGRFVTTDRKPKDSDLAIKQSDPLLKPQTVQVEEPTVNLPPLAVTSEVAESGDADTDESVSDLVGACTGSCYVTVTNGNMRRVIMNDDGTPKRDANGLPVTKDSPLFAVNSCATLDRPPPKAKYKFFVEP